MSGVDYKAELFNAIGCNGKRTNITVMALDIGTSEISKNYVKNFKESGLIANCIQVGA